jgi:maltose O-acetyltransferase
MKTEKEKMLAGEPYLAWDKELYDARIQCRKRVQKFNHTLPDSEEWKHHLQQLLPNNQGGMYVEPPFRCDYGSNIRIGKNFYANFNCTILDVNVVDIGDDVLLAPNVQIYTAGHPIDAKARVEEGIEFGLPIKIGDRVWLGGGVILCPGVTIGKNSVIGAGSVVTKDIPENVVAAGNPCRVIRTIESDNRY